MRHAVGASVEERYQVARLNGRELAVVGEEVAGLADRAYDIDDAGTASARCDRDNLMMRLVERWAISTAGC